MTDYIQTILGSRVGRSSNYDRYTGNTSNGYGTYRVASNANLNRISTDNSAKYGDTMSDMQYYFETGRSDQALKLYQELFESAKSESQRYGYELDDDAIRSNIDEAYKKYTGTTLNNEVNKICKNPFETGLMEGIPIYGWFFANSTSDEEAKAMKNNKSITPISQVGEVAGAAVSSAAGIVGLGLANGAIAGTSGVVGTALGVTGIKALTAGAAKILGLAAGGLGILPVVGIALAIGAAVVAAKHFTSK